MTPTWIAFLSTRAGEVVSGVATEAFDIPIRVRDIFVVRPDGSEVKQITDDRESYRSSAGRWAPDAPSLAYIGEEGLMIADVQRNVRRLLVRTGSLAELVDFAWDPAGQRLAVLLPREVRLYDLQGKMLATWTGPQGRPGVFWALDWSRTGVLAAFLKRAGIYVTTDTDRLQGWHRLSDFDGSFERNSLRWSPDGSRALFVGRARGSPIRRQTWLVNADGTDLRRLHPELSSSESNASWSPDGKMIAYSGFDFSSGVEQEHVYVAALDDSPPKDLTPQGARAVWPTWSPDGTKLAFAVRTDGRWHIYVVSADTGEGRLVTDGHGNDIRPVWSPM